MIQYDFAQFAHLRQYKEHEPPGSGLCFPEVARGFPPKNAQQNF